VEKKQYNLCIKVLTKFHKAGLLKDIILIGSWALVFYKDYFSNIRYRPSIRTRDIDLLIPQPLKIKKKVDIPELLKGDGFVVGFRGIQGYMALEHPDLIIEFLVPELGRGTSKPYKLDKLAVNAQALRYLNFLTDKTIKIVVGAMTLKLPHPAYYALHKLIISQKRKDVYKADKDANAAIDLLKALIRNKEIKDLRKAYESAPPKWQKLILKTLNVRNESELAELFSV